MELKKLHFFNFRKDKKRIKEKECKTGRYFKGSGNVMKISIVVDTNIIISAFLGGKPRIILFDKRFNFISNEVVLIQFLSASGEIYDTRCSVR